MNSPYILELPLKGEPSPHFKRFISKLMEDKELDCTVQYWRGKLTFSSDKMLNNEKKLGSTASTYVDSQVNFQQIAKFTSKFNAIISAIAMSHDSKNDIHIELRNKDNQYLIHVAVIVDNEKTQTAINNFFTVIGW